MNPQRIQKKINQAIKLNKKKQYREAKSVCKEIINKNRNIALAWKLLATNESCLSLWTEAIHALKKAISLGDNDLITYRFLATCYLESQQYSLAVQLLEDLFKQTKDNGLLIDLAINLQRMGALEHSLNIHNSLLKYDPNNAKLRLNRTILKLNQQAYGEEWNDYSYRHFMPNASCLAEEVAPLWQGEPLQGKSILVWQEQGIADQIIFSRTFSLIAKDTQKITVVGEPRLTKLLQNSFPELKFVEMIDNDSSAFTEQHFDYQILAGDLPRYYLKTAQSLALSYRRLRVPNIENTQILDQLPTNFKIGISWFAGSADAKEVNRWSLSTSALHKLSSRPDASYFSLQYGNYKEQLKSLNKEEIKINDVTSHCASGDFVEYAALINKMDLVIAVDNTAAILAAALGKEVWVLLPADPFWVWGVNATHKWYSNIRHFIKPWELSWVDFITQQVEPALIKHISEHKYI